MPDGTTWDDFRLVKAVADARSLGGAATTLGLNHSTIFRRLGALENALGTRLFERARIGYSPTAAGEEMIALANRMADDIIDFQRKVAGRDVKPSGELRVTTNDTMLVHLLTPIFSSFCKAYPDIRLDIIVANQALNLSKRDADVAVRATERPPETLVGRRIATIAWARYASSALAFETTVEDASSPWVGFGDHVSSLPAARWLAERVPADRLIYRVNTVLGLAEAVAAGMGFGFLPCFIGDRTAGLKRVGEPVRDLAGALWLLTHPDLRHSARVRAFMDHAGAELSKRRATVEAA
ncbi:MAG: LysR family transcriptional regulator [Methylobacteriaceae bacterium]|nr:LysR family transcriptional regulator [Methylobacteriaceae bacterium]